MQREKQHMRMVIDEYGSVAGLVTIEDLLEAIVGNIADEHDEPEADDAPIREPNGAYVVSGSFELSRLRDLFADQFEPAQFESSARHRPESETGEASQPHPADSPEEYDLRNVRANDLRDRMEPHDSRDDRAPRDTRDDPTALRLPEHYESTTLGGLVSEIAGHIPLPGEVVEEDGLRLEVLASTDRRIDRIRVSLIASPNPQGS
jgi:CBS domain containing-hemolysin-like protein